MVIIDTSVWISFFRAKPHACKNEVLQLLDDDRAGIAYPVLAELINGVRNRELAGLEQLLHALPVFYPTRKSCDMVTEMIHRSRRRGLQFGFADLLIAALANEADAELWSLDADFTKMQKLQLVKVYPWKNT